ncbi:PLP-dependent aminotransferase family protein [Ureibacillus chungkukjangi]|uniref:aminotransferase-like domain-containing protein n=1 Tax=Ureibacillus chungkukjangi TaxID=1202712 RepID=UPI00203DBC8E|nr:PLP-dependent aminotransferase family protein [Ureibacillus chungkukjangi]MCM3388906.1 PLP-dependent aminotransferase family protein [Ureibacillus chungkukjangi]
MKYSDKIQKTPSSFIRNILKVTDAPDVISFAGGLPNPISFPIEELQSSINHAIVENGAKLFQYSTTEGYLPLRQYIVDKYKKDYGLDFDPQDILITTGSQQALQLISQVLLNKGEGIVMEEPGYLGAIQAFSLAEPEFYSVTLEGDGLNAEQLEQTLANNDNIKFIYTVPNFHNPTGITYSREKREELYEVVKKYDVVLIEDDPYGELRWNGEKLPYIGAGRLENSVLLGSFSKIVTPGMRLGFVITKNKELMHHINTVKQATDLHTNIFSQMIIHDYLTSNDLQSHVSKIINLYETQANAMLNAIAKYFPSTVKYTKPDGGMFIWVTLEEGTSALEFFDKAMEKKVAFVPGDPFYTDKTHVNTLRLNYTNSSPEIIEEGIKRLGKILYSLSAQEADRIAN